MRITHSQLRRIIKEEVFRGLREMSMHGEEKSSGGDIVTMIADELRSDLEMDPDLMMSAQIALEMFTDPDAYEERPRQERRQASFFVDDYIGSRLSNYEIFEESEIAKYVPKILGHVLGASVGSGHSQDEIEDRAREFVNDLDAWELESDIMSDMAGGAPVPRHLAARWGDWSPEEIQAVIDLVMDMSTGRRRRM